MPFDSEVAVLGTGVAALAAANHLLVAGKKVLLLNPDRDFFLEDSELPLDPLLPGQPTGSQFQGTLFEKAISQLRPDFPGAVEEWPRSSKSSDGGGFHDPFAPHVRSRERLWIGEPGTPNWESLEELYVEASDQGLNPKILEGLQAAKKFPGHAGFAGVEAMGTDYRGLLIPKSCDVDVNRYRNGLLEYVRERLGADRVICGVSQLEKMPGGIRFHTQGAPQTARLSEKLLVFWTPRLTSWVLAQAKKAEVQPQRPQGIRLWEQWTLGGGAGYSHDLPEPIEPNVIGVFKSPHGDMAVWAEIEGAPTTGATSGPSLLTVLRAGPLVELDALISPQAGVNWASEDSFAALAQLCHSFMRWERISVRALRSRAIFEWDKPKSWLLSKDDTLIRVIPASDGSLVHVVQRALAACEEGL